MQRLPIRLRAILTRGIIFQSAFTVVTSERFALV